MGNFHGIVQAILEVWAAVFVVYIYFSIEKKGLSEDEAGKRFRILCIGVFAMLIIESIACIVRGKDSTFSYVMVRIFNFLYFEGNFAVAYLYYGFVRCSISEGGFNNPAIIKKSLIGMGALGTLLLASNFLTQKVYYFDSYNYYQRGKLYFAYLGIVLAMDVIMFVALKLHQDEITRRKFWVLLSFIYLPFVALAFIFFDFGITFGTLAYVAALLINYEYMIQEDEEGEDTLNCTDDLTPFEIEKAHVESYVEIEKERLGEKLNVEWNIRVTDFLIPPLALQILVENAIRHGVSKRIEGGTVVIKTEEKIGEVIVSVGDDGRGFDVSLLDKEVEHANSAHIGLLDVKKRIRLFCNGEVEIKSTINVGTLVKLHIPR